MTKVILVENESISEIDVDFSLYASYTNSPSIILGGDVTITGSNYEENLVLLGRKKSSTRNTNPILKQFSIDEDGVFGNVLIIMIDERGDPMNIDRELIKRMIFKEENVVKK